jgi:hypothetical protein
MRLLLLAALLLAAAFAALVPSRAQTVEACTPETAQPVGIETIQADYAAWEGRCVRLQGIAAAGTLFADRQALLEPRGAFDKDAKRSIVIYPGRIRAPDRPRMVEVVGALGSCTSQYAVIEEMRAADPDAFIMLGGYCHTSLANYVNPIEIRTISARGIPRLTEAEVTPDRRPLVDAPPTLAGRAESAAAARALLAALATGDESGFIRLTAPEAWDELRTLESRVKPDWLAERLAAAHRDFARLSPSRALFAAIHRQAAMRERVFIERDEFEYAREVPDTRLPLRICWCKTPDCAGRWPVLPGDTDNAPERPYLCVTSRDFTLGPGRDTVMQAELSVEKGGFTEPRWDTTEKR